MLAPGWYEATASTTLSDEDETAILVDYRYRPGTPPSGMTGPPEHYDPGEGPEIEIDKVRNAETEEAIEVDEAERERLEQWIAENEECSPEYEGPEHADDEDSYL